MKTRKIALSKLDGTSRIILPINPKDTPVTTSQKNSEVQLLNFGAANVPGERDLVRLTASSFFPSRQSPFYSYASMSPAQYIRRLQGWKDAKEKLRVRIPDIGFNYVMLIDRFNYTATEGHKDISFELQLSEYRTLNVPQISFLAVTTQESTGLKERPDTGANPASHVVRAGDTLWGLAVRFYGSGSEYTKIYEANKALIGSNPNLIVDGTTLVIP